MDCSHCYYQQVDLADDPVYQNSVKPFMWICAAILPSAYVIGLMFSLHTHADMVWKNSSTKAHGEVVVPPQKVYPVHIIHPTQEASQEPNEQTPLNASVIQGKN